jgi:diguanylate cyclase
MAEAGDRINTDNPTEVARETLRRLAMRRIAPTPDNYLALYEEITGIASTEPARPATGGPSAAAVLSGLVMDLNLYHPKLSDAAEALNQSIRAEDWTLSRKQLSQITRQLVPPPQPARSAATLVPQDDMLALMRELLVASLENGVVPQLAHLPRLAEKAQQLATAVRDARSDSDLRDAATALKSLWVSIELQGSTTQDQQETLKRILLLLVENIGELLDDDTWLRGQLDLVQEVVSGPIRSQSLQEAEKRLKEVIYKQSMVKHGLREATATLKATMTTFVSRLSDALAANDEYQDKISTHVERIKQTDDVLELNRILESLLSETRAAQADNRRAHDQLAYERDAAVQAEARIMQLETQLTEMSTLIREDPLTRSLNRRGLDDEFARESARADRHDTPFCIAVLDIDNFKALNDQRGHQSGDDALVHLVAVAREELRLTDHIARMGGEEFLIMLPNTPLEGAVKIITRLQRSLTRKYFLDKNEQVLITFSAGVAQRARGEPQEAAIARADAAMYAAKQAGKNRVHTAPDAVVEPAAQSAPAQP